MDKLSMFQGYQHTIQPHQIAWVLKIPLISFDSTIKASQFLVLNPHLIVI